MAATSQKRSGTTDLTVGKPLFQILRFALPLVLGTLFQQLYSFADTVIVGRCLGTNALGAVGTTYSLNFLILGFVQGACVGFGIPATVLYNYASSVLRALGDSRHPFYFLLVASVVNILLDYLFIVPLGMGVDGAAIATVLSQLLSGGLCAYWFFTRTAKQEGLSFRQPRTLLSAGHCTQQHQCAGRARCGLPAGPLSGPDPDHRAAGTGTLRQPGAPFPRLQGVHHGEHPQLPDLSADAALPQGAGRGRFRPERLHRERLPGLQQLPENLPPPVRHHPRRIPHTAPDAVGLPLRLFFFACMQKRPDPFEWVRPFPCLGWFLYKVTVDLQSHRCPDGAERGDGTVSFAGV